mgnify:FL=1
MSSKATISHGSNFHLFEECFDGESVYLEVENTDFEVDPDRVAVKIPLDAWNQMMDDYNEKRRLPLMKSAEQLELKF